MTVMEKMELMGGRGDGDGVDGEERYAQSRCMASIARRRRGGDPEGTARMPTQGEAETFAAAKSS